MTDRIAPQVGRPFVDGEQIIIPTYVRASEAPDDRGACVTSERMVSSFNPTGWYVEFHYPNKTEGYRKFIPFSEESEGAESQGAEGAN